MKKHNAIQNLKYLFINKTEDKNNNLGDNKNKNISGVIFAIIQKKNIYIAISG